MAAKTQTKNDDLLEVGRQETFDARLTRMADAVEGDAPKFAEELRKRVGKTPAKGWTATLRKAIPDDLPEGDDRRVGMEHFADRFSLTVDELAPNANRKRTPTIEQHLYMDVLRAEGRRKDRAPKPAGPVVDLEGLDDLSVKELKELAARPELTIELPSKARKADIVSRIKEAVQ